MVLRVADVRADYNILHTLDKTFSLHRASVDNKAYRIADYRSRFPYFSKIAPAGKLTTGGIVPRHQDYLVQVYTAGLRRDRLFLFIHLVNPRRDRSNPVHKLLINMSRSKETVHYVSRGLRVKILAAKHVDKSVTSLFAEVAGDR